MAVPKVAYTPMLAEALGGQLKEINLLVDDFKDWKSLGLAGEDESFIFGKNGKNRQEPLVWHVHLMPKLGTKNREEWQDAWEERGNRTSGAYLVYTDGGSYGFLLIDVINDPKGHDVWDPEYKHTRELWQFIADAFNDQGLIPSAKPVGYITPNDE